MVDLSDFIDPGDDDADAEAAEDLAALRACLQALADAIASTNLAVVSGALGNGAEASARVQSSVAALKRFHDAFSVLKSDGEDEDGTADEDA